MKKLLLLLASSAIVTTSATTVVSCSWKTPPISFEEISQVMKWVEQQVVENPQSDTGVGTLKSDSEFDESIFTMNYQKKTENNSTNIDLRKKWNDSVVNPVNSTMVDYIHSGKSITTGEDDVKMQTEEMKALTAKIQTYHFTTRVSDVFVENAQLETSESYWLSDKYQNPVTTFKRTVDEDINPIAGNQPIDKAANDLLTEKGVEKESGHWDKNFLIFDDNDIFNLSRSLRPDYYIVRFNVSFGINSKKTEHRDKKVCFYLDVKFNA
ncbi:Vmc-like lipoprotein signal peptide domain-containing protein [Spiroplasma alleghenense]|uniref:Lipoprotein n=1 Tax=Spiroplasma alleghenense TaxID=216931 RepID=A0A345Z310_9MOLU|nr:hypothetical protein [Spiroplasma alleghenense]AXK50989.1 hypothetical protein SALLE_v1c03150 [Spiroplasma alleghenense]